ncbi:3-hydroxyacyl-ACP dehydratase FabZ family protein [Alienimonas californiensis]|uniref:3-hydroxyacyl-[acyl-carrier-protein] dehydratase FabZ n=1 Tax=Alienimonas californiensis TaxID=2527989 RepID=A0A517P9Q5_9PLAN|nr:3-hydroxyacyl-ACP dehydratase FabZ family protein [Alienimonas californiensis]QDT16098.1 3-hydroxyacyl-[acyl-carrier-protein] dehydratase FabZ [Alienimonas californiensis]
MIILSLKEIERLIPHRPPFLWLDEASIDDEAEPGEERTILAGKRIDADLPLFEGHYPGAPLLPGVIQLEMCYQAGAVLIAALGQGGGGLPVIARTDGVKFKRMIRPGDTCQVEVTIKDRLPGAVYLTGKVSVGGKLACRCDFTTAEAQPGAL